MHWNNVQFLFFNPTLLGNTTFGVNGPNYHVKGVEAQFSARVDRRPDHPRARLLQRRHPGELALPDEQHPGAAPTFGKCITQVDPKGSSASAALRQSVRRAGHGAGLLAEVPGQHPRPLRLERWATTSAFVMVGGSYTGSMFNQPATYPSGDGVLIPNTTLSALPAAGLHAPSTPRSASPRTSGTPSSTAPTWATPTPARSPRRPSSSSPRCRCGRG